MTNILVTGASGFVGKHLLMRSGSKQNFIPVSLKDLPAKDEFISGQPVDHVIHLAAKTYVPDSWLKPGEFYDVNVMGTQKVLDFCKEKKCGLTYVSSYVYGVPEYLPIDEKHKTRANTPYNHSKLLGEELCRFYHEAFGINTAIIRPFNIYGPNQNKLFLISKIIEQTLVSAKINLESLEPRRDYLHVEDFINLLVKTIGFKGCDFFNAGFGNSYSVKQIAELIVKLSGKTNVDIESSNLIRNNEVMDVVANIAKAKSSFSWTPEISLENGLTQIINSYGK